VICSDFHALGKTFSLETIWFNQSQVKNENDPLTLGQGHFINLGLMVRYISRFEVGMHTVYGESNGS
jgi:hypothetical protein